MHLIRLNPDEIHPDDLINHLKNIEQQVGDITNFDLRTRVIDIPVLYQDPWTHETLMRFRDRHQHPEGTDLEYAAQINGYKTVDDFIAAHSGSPYFFDYLRAGARSYIAFAGGIDVPLVLSSRSTYPLTGMGGLQGRKLQIGDQLPVGTPSRDAQKHAGRRLPAEYIPTFATETELRVIIGLCSYRLTEESKENFLQTTWIVTPDADRIGYRYKGGHIEFVPREAPFGAGSDPSNVVDLGYPIGSIQVPGGIEPIVLLNDAVTGGGYATIGTVISVDLDRLAQSKTNDKTRFRSVTLDEALQARKERQQKLAEIASLLTP